MAGESSTNTKGVDLLNLNKLLCLRHDEDSGAFVPEITNEPWFVANALSDKPVIITTSYEMNPLTFPPNSFSVDEPPSTPPIYEVTVKVMSWNLDGTFAPKIDFSWHCIVEGIRVAFLSG